MKLLDTSVAVDHLREIPPATDLLTRLTEAGEDIAASELVRFEILAGVRAGEIDQLESFFRTLVWVVVDTEVAQEAARLGQIFRASHSGIDDIDYLLGATAMVLDAELLTMNVRHFPMYADLHPAY